MEQDRTVLPLGRVHISTEAERQYREAGEPVGPGIWHEGFKRGFTYALSLRDAEQPLDTPLEKRIIGLIDDYENTPSLAEMIANVVREHDAKQAPGDSRLLECIRLVSGSCRRFGEHSEDRDQRIFNTIEGLLDGSISPELETFRQRAERNGEIR